MQSTHPKGQDIYIELPTDFTGGKLKFMVPNLNNILYGQV